MEKRKKNKTKNAALHGGGHGGPGVPARPPHTPAPHGLPHAPRHGGPWALGLLFSFSFLHFFWGCIFELLFSIISCFLILWVFLVCPQGARSQHYCDKTIKHEVRKGYINSMKSQGHRAGKSAGGPSGPLGLGDP